MNILYLIPARAGSKGLPGKNRKILIDKPLIGYTIDFAREFSNDSNIILSTDDDHVINYAKTINLEVPFKRPFELASDTASSYDVILHALKFYINTCKNPDILILLQPTSPFRKIEDLNKMLSMWHESFDLLVSVKESHENPYFNLFEENELGNLMKSKNSLYNRRQDCPRTYSFNGSIYIYNVKSLLSNKKMENFIIKKYLMNDPILSIDIDDNFDWLIAETVLKNEYFKK